MPRLQTLLAPTLSLALISATAPAQQPERTRRLPRETQPERPDQDQRQRDRAPSRVEMHEDFGPLGDMAGFEWTIDAAWSDGSPLRARNLYRPILGGRYMTAQTFADDGEGEYERYFTVYSVNAETGDIDAHGFGFNGATSTVSLERVGDAGSIYRGQWPDGQTEYKQEIEIKGDHCLWRVWSRQLDTEEWSQIMDARWDRGRRLRPLPSQPMTPGFRRPGGGNRGGGR